MRIIIGIIIIIKRYLRINFFFIWININFI
jgi:hypothetical protein